jgi:hypothetical protein
MNLVPEHPRFASAAIIFLPLFVSAICALVVIAAAFR